MCIFCKIINKEIPSSVVYEDDKHLAILDISQVTMGHTLTMPKKHYENSLEMPADEFSEYAAFTQKVAGMIMEKTRCAGMNILNNTNAVAGQTVNHVHFHIIPRYSENDSIVIEFNKSEEQDLDKVLELLSK